MKIQTLSIVVGGNKCNAHCPYCVSKMTGKSECEDSVKDINWRNFHKACEFAKQSGVSTVLLTGKGEPLLYKEHILAYLRELERYKFPFIELQTNGIELPNIPVEHFKLWYNAGLTTVSLSCTHWYKSYNKVIFGGKYGDLHEYVKILHNNNFFVRLSCVMLRMEEGVYNLHLVKQFIEHCKIWGVEQLTIRSVNNISKEDSLFDSVKSKIYYWVEKHRIGSAEMQEIINYFDCGNNATLLLELVHGAKVYDYKGQNISISNCLTSSTDPEDIRQLIFYSDGKLMFDWRKKGARIL